MSRVDTRAEAVAVPVEVLVAQHEDEYGELRVSGQGTIGLYSCSATSEPSLSELQPFPPMLYFFGHRDSALGGRSLPYMNSHRFESLSLRRGGCPDEGLRARSRLQASLPSVCDTSQEEP